MPTKPSVYSKDIDEALDEHEEKHRLKSQAERLIMRFGGVRNLAERLKAVGVDYSYSAIYKWCYSKFKHGTDGIIPTSAWPAIIKAARLEGLLLGERDFDIRWLK